MKNFITRILLTILSVQAVFLASPSAAYAKKVKCPPPTIVSIDVKPGSAVNTINLSSNGLLPVAVLTTDTFDASLFAPEMAHLGDASTAMGCEGAEAARWTYTDVNGDGLPDLVFFFRIQDLNLTTSTTTVMLMAHGMYGSTMIHIEGTDSVIVKF